MAINQIDPSALLAQIQKLESTGLAATREESGSGFADLLVQGINNVNKAQTNAAALAEAFERGETDADLSEVMIALQKAGLSFQAMTEVRNQLVNAYQEIMNMPI